MSTEIRDLQINPEEHHPSLGTFKFGVAVADPYETVFYDESYFKFEFFQGSLIRDGITENKTRTPLEK